jgi:uncharacterized protein (UPF0548 family)
MAVAHRWSRARYEGELRWLSDTQVNFEPPGGGWPGPDEGWNVDERVQALPSESPGPPEAEGSFEMATRLMRGYRFADPSIVRAIFDADRPLEGRDMLLELRFRGLRFPVGVRITSVYEENRVLGGRKGRVWGWSYRTLQGHLEQGEMHWQVWKWLATGEVDFRIHSYSRRAAISNPLVRLGFALFGRREQLRFLDSTCRRMAALTEAALRGDHRIEAVRTRCGGAGYSAGSGRR